MEYRIRAKTLREGILTFTHVKGYEIKDGLVLFVDVKTGRNKRFAVANCEIEDQR